MISRFPLFFLLILLLLNTIYALFTRPFTCTDSSGCILLGSQDPVTLGLSIITAGSERTVSLELQHSIELYTKYSGKNPTDHPLDFHPYYSPCLPGAQVESNIDLSADRQVLVVVGPVCGQDTANFVQRMVSANKLMISPIPNRAIPNDMILTVYPDIKQLANQASAWIQRMGLKRILVNHDIDDQSSEFSAELCKILNLSGVCLDHFSASAEHHLDQSDAFVQVFLDETNPFIMDTNPADPAIPRILVSFSRPQVADENISPFFWIGPRAWSNNQDYSAAYFASYNNFPTSLASWLVYASLPKIETTIRESAEAAWDGSWVIPIEQFNQRLIANFLMDDFFCAPSASDCSNIPFILYQVTGNEYAPYNP